MRLETSYERDDLDLRLVLLKARTNLAAARPSHAEHGVPPDLLAHVGPILPEPHGALTIPGDTEIRSLP